MYLAPGPAEAHLEAPKPHVEPSLFLSIIFAHRLLIGQFYHLSLKAKLNIDLIHRVVLFIARPDRLGPVVVRKLDRVQLERQGNAAPPVGAQYTGEARVPIDWIVRTAEKPAHPYILVTIYRDKKGLGRKIWIAKDCLLILLKCELGGRIGHG